MNTIKTDEKTTIVNEDKHGLVGVIELEVPVAPMNYNIVSIEPPIASYPTFDGQLRHLFYEYRKPKFETALNI